MAIKKVEIKITSLEAANKLGAGNKLVPEHLAKEYERKGWAKIINAFPAANPEPTVKEIEEETKKVYMPEEHMLTKGCYIGNDKEFEKTFLAEGTKFGYKVSTMEPNNFSSGKLVMNGFVVCSSDTAGFEKKQLMDLRAVLFQKRVPFVFRMDDIPDVGPEMAKDKYLRQSFILALFTVFKTGEIMDEIVARYGELIQADWLLETDATPGDFWKLLDKQMLKFQEYMREKK
jgi:hypothetical protein